MPLDCLTGFTVLYKVLKLCLSDLCVIVIVVSVCHGAEAKHRMIFKTFFSLITLIKKKKTQ